MPYAVSKTQGLGTTAGSSPYYARCPLSANAVDDLILVWTQEKFTTISAPTNWYNPVSTGDLRLFAHKVTTPLTSIDLTASNSSNAFSYICLVVRDADVSDMSTDSWLDVSGTRASSSGTTHINPTVTTTTDDCLITSVIGQGADSNRIGFPYPGYIPIGAGGNSFNCYNYGFYWAQESAGATGTSEAIPGQYSASHNPSGIVAAIKNATSGSPSHYCDVSSEANRPFKFIHCMDRSGGGSGKLGTATESEDITSIITSVGDAPTVINKTFSGENGQLIEFNRNAKLETDSGSEENDALMRAAQLASAQDISGETIAVTTKVESNYINNHAYPGVCIGFMDSADGYKLWSISGRDAAPNVGRVAATTLIDLAEGTEVEESGTALDLTDVDRVAAVFCPRDNFAYCTFSPIMIMQTLKALGGDSNQPVDFAKLKDITDNCALFTIQDQSGQSDSQFVVLHDIQVGDGGTSNVYWDSTGQAVSYPGAYSTTSSPVKMQAQIAAASRSFVVDTGTGKTVNLINQPFDMGNYHNWTLTSGDIDINGAVITNATVSIADGLDSILGGFFFSGCKEITNLGDCSTGGTFDSGADTNLLTFSGATQAALQAAIDHIANCNVSASTTAIRVEFTGTGNISLDFDNITWTGNTTDIHYNSTNSSQLTAVMENGSNASTTAISGSATGVTISAPTTDIEITVSEAGSLIRLYTGGTQTQLDKTASGTTLTYTYTGTGTFDWTVDNPGFLPQKGTVTGNGADIPVAVTLVPDPVYDASHGLTYTTDASWSRANNELTVPTFGPSFRAVYSLMIDAFADDTITALRNTDFNIQMNGPLSMFLIEDAEGASDATVENMTSGGCRYVNTSEVTTAEWVGVESIGTATGFTGEYQQQDGSGTTDARATGKFDQAIKVYGDASHGNFDYRGNLVLKYQPNGYREVRVDVLDTYGISTLEPTHYIIAMEPVAISAATGDPALTITITDHGASPVSWQSKNWGITVTDNATQSTAENILRELNYNLSLDATYQGKDPFNWPEMVKELGSSYETIYGYTEGAQSSTLKGVRVVQNDGTTAHAGFTRFQADDGTYYTPATVAQISAPNLTAGRIQIVNETGRTASAWASSTAYALYDKVLRSTGVGTESGIGLYFQCTTAGTTGGTEPTWDTTPGNTTADGTAVWTCRAIEFDNTTTTSGYSNSWTDHEDFDNGDTIRLRWVDEDDGEISAEGVATAEGTTTFLNTPVSDDVYDSYGIDGSTVTEYSADYPNVEVDVTDPDNVFYLDRFYAWYKYNLTLADGIRNFFGGVSATDTSNITINNSIVDIYFDNTKSTSARQGDTIVIQRSDGAYPQVTVTSGGGGLGFYYTGIGYSTSSGSGLDTTERNKLLNLRDYDPEGDVIENSLTYQEAQRIMFAESAGKVAVSGSTVTFRDNADSKARITATVDSNGQRTAVTVDGS